MNDFIQEKNQNGKDLCTMIQIEFTIEIRTSILKLRLDPYFKSKFIYLLEAVSTFYDIFIITYD
jgi:hypothetical protein